ncbi:hypothetical protein HMPREF9946_02230 [Acetobacteraceae bacterium AT-5844]|nr:hypothetical protein HMPREF9946_02230 [Acetobacteraceae bacterium AT-5844]
MDNLLVLAAFVTPQRRFAPGPPDSPVTVTPDDVGGEGFAAQLVAAGYLDEVEPAEAPSAPIPDNIEPEGDEA